MKITECKEGMTVKWRDGNSEVITKISVVKPYEVIVEYDDGWLDSKIGPKTYWCVTPNNLTALEPIIGGE